jgi:putative transposase
MVAWGHLSIRRRPMRTGRPKIPIVLTEEEQQQLKALAGSRSLPHGVVTRARIILMDAEGLTNQAIARRVELSMQAVSKWRKRYVEQGLSGLHDELRPGRPRSISDEEVAAVVKKTLQTKPKDGTHWTIRSIAKEAQLSIASGKLLVCNLIASVTSNSRPTRSLWRRSGISWGCI